MNEMELTAQQKEMMLMKEIEDIMNLSQLIKLMDFGKLREVKFVDGTTEENVVNADLRGNPELFDVMLDEFEILQTEIRKFDLGGIITTMQKNTTLLLRYNSKPDNVLFNMTNNLLGSYHYNELKGFILEKLVGKEIDEDTRLFLQRLGALISPMQAVLMRIANKAQEIYTKQNPSV